MKNGFFARMRALLCPSALAEGKDRPLPAVGELIEGFCVTETGRIESLGADAVMLTHRRTGARVIFALNDDVNRGFSICFHTEPSDDTGMLHILEHASCAASRKYPGRDVFFDAIAQAYITNINAWTSRSSTNYFVTSMDEDQLAVLTDFYLDCAFHSAILTEPNYFRREGWRYELDAPDGELTINGIVYNEMCGVYGDIFEAALTNAERALFPDSCQSRTSGGDPARIPDLTYEALIDFYRACYTPANSLSVFYGDLDLRRFLKLLNDGYFSVVDPGTAAPISAGQAAFAAPVHAVCDFPVAEHGDDANAVIMYMAALPAADSADYVNFAICDVVSTLLSDDSSRLMEALNASGIGSSYSVYCDQLGCQLILNFTAEDADASRDEEFKAILFGELRAMLDAGFDRDLMASLFAGSGMTQRLARNESNVAVSLFSDVVWIQEMGNTRVLDKAARYAEAAARCTPGYAEAQLRRWVLDNPLAALVSTVPKPGLLEENRRALREKLAARKARMSAAEIDALVGQTRDFKAWVERETPAETLQRLDVVGAENVSAEFPRFEIEDRNVNGARIRSAKSDMDMCGAELRFDLSALDAHALRLCKMLSSLVGCSTRTHTQREITTLSALNIHSLNCGVYQEQTPGGCRPILRAGFFAPRERVREAVALVMEMLRTTDIAGNMDLLRQNIASAVSSYRDPESMVTLLSTVAAAPSDPDLNALLAINGMDYLDELKAALKRCDRDAAAFARELEMLRDRMLVRGGAHVQLAGDADGAARAALAAALAELPDASTGVACARPVKPAARRTAFTASTQADYLVRAIGISALDSCVSGDKLVLCQLLSSEYLMPKLRLQMGAYNVGMSLGVTDGIWAINVYRGDDAFAAEAVIHELPAYLEALELTQRQLDSYKLPVISSLLQPNGELNDALRELSGVYSGFTRARRLELVEQVRKTSVEDLKALAPLLRAMLERSGSAIITTAAKARAHAAQLDAIVKLA